MTTVEHGSDSAAEGKAPSGLVVIGASAGGIDAVLTLVGSLPADFPAPIVIAQHIDPHRRSQFGDLLAKRSALPVLTASADEPLQAGTVYVVPADRDVEISDHHIGVRRDRIGPSHPSVDRLMSTAARVFGDTLTGVVLTGTGADGAAGAQAIKAYGGTVIVQNPQSARYPGMPASVPPSAVDIVADLEAIGPLLVELFSGNAVLPPTDDDGEFRSFLNRVREQSGLDFGAYKRPTIERRLQRRMVAVGMPALAEYQDYVERHPAEMQRLVTSFLIKVTRFFRDPELFAHLRDHVLPSLIEDARGRGELRLWSAGCATGEEAYTLAMLVTDLLGDDLQSLTIRIFATDIAADAVDFARQGVYPESALADLPAGLVERHFTRRDGAFEVRKHVRGLVVFGEHDLSRRAPFPRIDLVLCRNVLIYFAPELQQRSLQLFAFSLRAGGYLALGKAETVNPLPEFFRLEQSRLKVFCRIGGQAPIPPHRIFELSPSGVDRPRQARAAPVESRARFAVQPTQPSLAVLQSSRTIEALSAGVAIIDRDYHIRSINLAARRLLGIAAAGPGEDLIHRAAPALAGPLRREIDLALRGTVTTTIHRTPQDALEEDGRDLIITCTPAPSTESGGSVDAMVLEVVDVTLQAKARRQLAQDLDRVTSERDALQDRISTATTEVRELRSADQTMATDLGRLRAENEQLQLSSEEAQAATEEIETLNEEQQATNEELETLNEELQATVEELNTTNADLQARTLELEGLATTLESRRGEIEAERGRLEAILTNMGEAVLVVDASGEVELTNPAWRHLLGSVGELVPEDELGRPLPPAVWPHRRALENEASTLEFTLPGPGRGRRWFEARTQPVHGGKGARWGVVVIRDITDRSLRQLQQQFLALASHELRTPLTTLSGSLQLIARRLPGVDENGRLQRHVARAREQVERLDQYISELTDVVHLQSGRFRVDRVPLDLMTLVEETLEVARYLPNGLEIRSGVPEGSIPISGDARRLEQVVLNLLANAFRHAPDSGGVDVRLRTEGGAAVIEVQDYGPGIPKEALREIFSRFYRVTDDKSSRAGLGLGLLIAREIVTSHGGTIDVESIVGEGTTFAVRLPLLGDEENGAEDRDASQDRRAFAAADGA